MKATQLLHNLGQSILLANITSDLLTARLWYGHGFFSQRLGGDFDLVLGMFLVGQKFSPEQKRLTSIINILVSGAKSRETVTFFVGVPYLLYGRFFSARMKFGLFRG